MKTNQYESPNPTWWDDDYDSNWERVKMAVKRDWDQTKHDFGGDEPDTNQNIARTVNQAVGKETIPRRGEPIGLALVGRRRAVALRGEAP